jgi:hypothetical protein
MIRPCASAIGIFLCLTKIMNGISTFYLPMQRESKAEMFDAFSCTTNKLIIQENAKKFLKIYLKIHVFFILFLFLSCYIIGACPSFIASAFGVAFFVLVERVVDSHKELVDKTCCL